MNKKYYDIIPEKGGGGGCVFDADKINAQLKTITDIQDEAYDLGVTNCISMVEKIWGTDFPETPSFLIIKEKLQSLKKQ